MAKSAMAMRMAFSNDPQAPVTITKPIYLMTATIKNSYHTWHQPKIKVVGVARPDAKDSTDRLNFKIDALGRDESDSPNGSTYLIRLELDRGAWVIHGFPALSSSFPIHGYFYAPLAVAIGPNEPGIYCLGHIDANVRERTGDEFRAGPVIPLLDQAIAGASGGTFEIEISDQWATDEAKFKRKFPGLANAPIKLAILPPFDRAKVQALWASH